MDEDITFNIHEALYHEIHALIEKSLDGKDEETREYVITKLNDEFRFLEHLYKL